MNKIKEWGEDVDIYRPPLRFRLDWLNDRIEELKEEINNNEGNN